MDRGARRQRSTETKEDAMNSDVTGRLRVASFGVLSIAALWISGCVVNVTPVPSSCASFRDRCSRAPWAASSTAF
jgi:hypothetical protein